VNGEVERYVAGLGAALRGPHRAKADLLAEARDGLTDAADAYRETGMSTMDAERRAVADFGGLAEIVPGYQAELAVAQGRRTALLIAAGLVGVYACTRLAWPGDAAWLTGWFRGLCLGGAVLAALARLGLGWGSRFVPDGVALTRLLGGAGLAFLALHGMVGLGVFLWHVAQWPAAAALAAPFGYAAVCAARCVLMTRRRVPWLA
jgi:hypothetical protein